MGKLTYKEMVQKIAAGESVMWNGTPVTSVSQLPSPDEASKGDVEAAKALLAELEADEEKRKKVIEGLRLIADPDNTQTPTNLDLSKKEGEDKPEGEDNGEGQSPLTADDKTKVVGLGVATSTQ